ncbi:MAG TPA: response regulator, partial [Allocoleopsis sp.]
MKQLLQSWRVHLFNWFRHSTDSAQGWVQENSSQENSASRHSAEDQTRQQVEEALRESEARLRLALEAAQMSTWDWDLLANQVIWSGGHEHLFGRDKGQFDGSYEMFMSHIHPDDRTPLLRTLNQAKQDHRDYSCEFRVVWADNSIHWIESRGKFFYNEAGAAIRMIGTMRDISHRKQVEADLHLAKNELELRVAERTAELFSLNRRLQAELDERQRTQEALRISQARFAGIVSVADDAIISIDRHQQITLFNRGAEKIFGYSESEVLGKPLDVLMPLRYVQMHQRHVVDFGDSTSAARRMAERREIYGRRKDGTEFPAEASISKLDLGEEKLFTVILRDITERKQVERMKDEFISVVSHELRTPLTSIHGSLGMLMSGLLQANSEQGKRLLQIAVESTDRLVRLVNDILDIERIESGKVKMEKVDCLVDDLVGEAIDVVQPIADKAQVSLIVSASALSIWADPDRLVQTLTNLLSNAIKFSPPGSSVELSTILVDPEKIDPDQLEQDKPEQDKLEQDKLEQDKLEQDAIDPASPQGIHASMLKAKILAPAILFTVRDRGRGIPADKLDSIFERFQQVDSSDSRNHDGTGLGLAICRSIVQQHGGQIWVESCMGQGSSFYFTIPAVTQPHLDTVSGVDALQALPPAPDRLPHVAPLVLICDDDTPTRNLLKILLEERQYRVITVASGEEAIAQAQQQLPDVILMDLLLPGMSGWETIATLKQQELTRSIPIIICSISTPDLVPDLSPASSAEFIDWVSKPLDEASLFQALQEAIAQAAHRIRILIVEDDSDLAQMLSLLFQQHGMETFHARTGREAIYLSQQVNPDLLILDLVLPKGDGFTVVDWLQQHNHLCRTPLVVYSARDLDEAER